MAEIKLNQQNFEELITRRGIPVKWERSMRCSCWSEDSGQPQYSCKACQGWGYVYEPPIEEDAVLVMALQMNRNDTPQGEFRLGDAVMTVPMRKRTTNEQGLIEYVDIPIYNIGEWDRVSLMNTTFRSHEHLVRGQGVYGRMPDTLRNPDVTSVLKVAKMDATTGSVTEYIEDEDYQVFGNYIQWASGQGPSIGDRYSVLYYHRPVYIVYQQLPQHRDPDQQHFPKRVVLRYRDVI